MRQLILAAGAVLALSLQTPLRAETVLQLSRSPIARVTAYQGQGIVTREARIRLNTAGNYQLRISDVPLGIVADSLHVSGQGGAGAVIQNVQLIPLPASHESAEIKALDSRIAELEARIARLSNSENVNERAQEWLDSYWERQPDESKRPNPADWQKTLDFLSQNQARILENSTAVALQKQTLDVALAKLKAERQELNANEQHKTQAAVIYFSARNAGDMTFQISYLVSGIHWTPSYDARLEEAENKVSLTYFGDVVQQTGEAWPEVELSLSTAVPQINAAVPALTPWILTDQMPPADRARSQGPGSDAKGFADMDMAPEPELDEASGEREKARFAESEIQTQGLSVLFKIPQRVSIDSAPYPRRVAIATRSFKYEPEYHVVPKLSPRVYLKARFRNSSDLPLLPGQIRNYVDQDYTGTSQIPLVRPGEEASLNFGVDESIRVTRKQGLETSTLEGLMRDVRRRVMSYEIEVSNFKQRPIDILVWDHLPFVQDESRKDIRIEVLQMQPTPTERSPVNLLKWALTLAPQEKKTIKVSYAVEHPAALEVYTNFSNEDQSLRKRSPMQYEKF